jgi:hypothetical protein
MIDCRVSPTLLISAQVEGQEKILEWGTLHERAWCFQEVQLAPRLLSYGGKELYFQCRSGAYREGNPTEIFLDDGVLQNVEMYSDRGLSFSSDRLVAISGLASRFPSFFEDEDEDERPTASDYLASLWRGDLIRVLMWEGNRKAYEEPPPPSPYCAPSWSWAAIDTGVGGGYSNWWDPGQATSLPDRTLCEVLGASMNALSDSIPYGAVKSGELARWGPVAPLPQSVYDVAHGDRPLYLRRNAPSGNRDEFAWVEDDSKALPYLEKSDSNTHDSNASADIESQGIAPHDVGERLTDESHDDDCRSEKNDVSYEWRSIEDDPSDDSSSFVGYARSSNSRETLASTGISVPMIRWDVDTSRDINCICLLVTLDWGIVLSPVRKPGAPGIFQRVGFLHGRDIRAEVSTWYAGPPHWEHRVVTII